MGLASPCSRSRERWSRRRARRRGSTSSQKLTKVTLQLKWVTQAQFAGYYAAKAKGYYQKAGLDVTIKPGGPNIVPEQVVAGGQAQFGIDWLSSLMLSRAKNVPLVSISQVFNKSGLTLLDLEGHRHQHGREDEEQEGRELAVRQRVRGLRRAREVRDGSRAQQGRDDRPAAVHDGLLPEAAGGRRVGDDVQRARAGARGEEPEDGQALHDERPQRHQDAERRHRRCSRTTSSRRRTTSRTRRTSRRRRSSSRRRCRAGSGAATTRATA